MTEPRMHRCGIVAVHIVFGTWNYLRSPPPLPRPRVLRCGFCVHAIGPEDAVHDAHLDTLTSIKGRRHFTYLATPYSTFARGSSTGCDR
jgi:hypothetical protein